MSSIYIPSSRGGGGTSLDTAYLQANYTTKPEFRSAIQSLEETNSHHEESILALESQISSAGLKVWDSTTSYAKDQIVIDGVGPSAKFYRSLIDGNLGNDPATEDTAWTLQAGDFRSPLSGDLTGFTDSSQVLTVGGAAAADIADVTTAIKAGTLDHDTAVTIGETAAVVNVGTGANPKTINLGGAGDTVAIAGTLATIDTTNLQVADSLIRVNKGGTAGSGSDAGLEIEENGAVAGYVKTNGSRDGFVLKAPTAAEIALNQSVSTSSSPSFQALTTAGYVNSTGLYSSKGIAINNWDNDMLSNNYCFIGRNRVGGTGRMSFGVHPGGGYGGFDWVTIGSSGTAHNVPMTLSRDGALEVAGSITAPSGTINGNLTVTGTITASNMPASQSASLVGLWGGAFSNLAGGVYVRKFGPMVSVEIDYFDLGATHATNEGVYSEMLPTWARPAVAGNRPLSFAVPFINGTATLARLYISSAGRISFKPLSQWSLSPARPDGTISVSYYV